MVSATQRLFEFHHVLCNCNAISYPCTSCIIHFLKAEYHCVDCEQYAVASELVRQHCTDWTCDLGVVSESQARPLARMRHHGDRTQATISFTRSTRQRTSSSPETLYAARQTIECLVGFRCRSIVVQRFAAHVLPQQPASQQHPTALPGPGYSCGY